MKAIIHEEYGPPEVLELREVETPVPRNRQVLIRVHAASLNASDWETLRGKPLYARLGGLRKPQHRIPGSDIAGRVEAVGENVESFQPGDEVFGDTMWDGAGAFAEYVCVPETAPILPKPPGLSFAEAACLPQAGVIAMQGLEWGEGIREGDRVLINGAGGGTGTLAVQMAKSAGAEVTGVDNGHKMALLRSLGADRVVDYTREDFTKQGLRYDVILDVAAHRSIFAYRRALDSGGRYSLAGGSMNSLLQAAFLGPVISRFGDKRLRLLMVKTGKGPLQRVLDVVERGGAAPVIDQTYSLAEVPDALRRMGEGRALGKLVITVTPDGG